MESNTAANPAIRLRKQQELAARFGLFALKAQYIPDVLQEACIIVSLGLGVSFAKVLRYLPEEHQFLLEAGVGWAASEIGVTRLGADLESPAGYAFQTSQPVFSNDLSTENRFRTPELLQRYAVRGAVNVIIRGDSMRYGVLEADAPSGEHISQRDVAFLDTIATIIALALERRRTEDSQHADDVFSAGVLEASNDCIQVIDLAGTIEFINANGLQQMEIPALMSVKGQPWHKLWPDSQAKLVEQAIEDARQGKPSRFEAPRPSPNNSSRWWDVSISPLGNQQGEIKHLVAVARDITERVHTEASLSALLSNRDSLLGRTELLMLEVHHRVRNSLQLIQTLLLLQSSNTHDDSVREQLKTAASRVMTVAAVHKRLHEQGAPVETDAAAYLQGLVHELQYSLVEQNTRRIKLVAAELLMPAERLSSLGLITAELVTNALKYGKGTVTVSLYDRGDTLELVVEDEGHGFPASFPTSHSGGLGIRLVKMFSRGGENSLYVDRTVPHSRITVRLPITRSA